MPWRDDSGGRAPTLLLGVFLALAAALMLALTWDTTFFQDSWAFIVDRRGYSAYVFLTPHNEHIVVIPVAIEKLFENVFGLGTQLPEQLLLTAMLSLTGVLVFVYARRRVGPWAALIGTVPLLFLGAAWEVILWPFEISLVGSVLTGVAMLLALEREDRRGDVWACLLALLSIGFSSLGVAFCAAAVVDVVQRRASRGLKRAYVAAVPLALYVVWYVAYGHEAQHAASLHNAIHAPSFLAEGLAASTGAVLGVSWIAEELPGDPRRYGTALALLAALALFVWLWRRSLAARARLSASLRPSSRLWPLATAAAAFWLLGGLNRIPGREANASRYLYMGGVFVLLLAADLLAGTRIKRPALIAAAAVAAAAVGSNLVPLLEGADKLDEQTTLARADLGSIEIARRTVEPGFWLDPETAGTPSLLNVTAGPYLEVSDEFGSPAYTPAELARAPELGRRQADVVLAAALPISVRIGTGPPPQGTRRAGCRRVPVAAGDRAEIPLRPGLSAIEAGPRAGRLRLRRFAVGEYPVGLGRLPAGSTALLRIPPDRAARPWRLRAAPLGGATVCRLR
jgi:hypothetical protein